jgi:hypothetical protein
MTPNNNTFYYKKAQLREFICPRGYVILRGDKRYRSITIERTPYNYTCYYKNANARIYMPARICYFCAKIRPPRAVDTAV